MFNSIEQVLIESNLKDGQRGTINFYRRDDNPYVRITVKRMCEHDIDFDVDLTMLKNVIDKLAL